MGAEARGFVCCVRHSRLKPLRDARGEVDLSGSGGSLRLSLPGEAEGLVSVPSAMFFLNSLVAQYKFLCRTI